MTGKEDQALAKAYQSDPGETEDEEVKRNCIMGESGMRDSDFFDSDSDEEEVENEVHIDGETKGMPNEQSEEDRIVELVKFVSVGSQILKPKGAALCRPTPIVPSPAMHAKNTEDNDETLNKSNLKTNLSVSQSDSKSGFSPRSKCDHEIEISASSTSTSSRDSDSESNDGDVESVESDADINSSSLDFPFEGGEELSLEVGAVITHMSLDIDKSCCKSSFDDQQEAQESMNGDCAIVGASGASVDDKWHVTKQKRVLSCNTLYALNQDAGRDEDHSKKTRLSQQSSEDVCAIPEIALGTEALDEIIQPLPRQYLIRDDSLLIPSCSDEDEDIVLSEELEEKFRNKRCSVANFPIPLLTPPQSPRTVGDTIEEQEMSVIEWPSNLVMDSAIIKAFANISPLSTICNRDEQFKIDDSVSEPAQRNLVPRVRTISVEAP